MNSHPVDSTYHRCCNAIGRHGRSCTAVQSHTIPTDVPGAEFRVEFSEGHVALNGQTLGTNAARVLHDMLGRWLA